MPYELVRLSSGAYSIRSMADDETFHPGIGPAAEAEALYVRQLRLIDRALSHSGEEGPFVIWDVGLGGGANVLTALRSLNAALTNAEKRHITLEILSFDRTTEAAQFALKNADKLEYIEGFELALEDIVRSGRTTVRLDGVEADWTLRQSDLPELLRSESVLPPPHVIFFDPHSPKANPEMWTVSVFANMFRRLDPDRPCALATFSRSSMARTAMLLGGFHVGTGRASGAKEETTVAANRLELLNEPLGRDWLERARRSSAAEPLVEGIYRQSKLRDETWQQLIAHPQFGTAGL